jgi:hypothetical protein
VSEFDPAPASTRPLRAVLVYWPMSLAISLLGLVLGIGAGSAKAPTYTSEVRLAIGGQGLASYAIPGFALAAQELAADYARYVSLSQDQTTLKTALGSRAGEVVGLSASPIPNSSIVSIVALAKNRDIADKAATAVAGALVTAVNGQANAQVAASLLKQYEALSTTAARANQDLQQAQSLVAKLTAVPTTPPNVLSAVEETEVGAATRYASLQLQQAALASRYQAAATSDTPSSNLNIVQPAIIILDNTTKNEELYGLVGLAGGSAIALVAATLRARGRRNRRGSADADDDDERDILPGGTKLSAKLHPFGRKPTQPTQPKQQTQPKDRVRLASTNPTGGRNGEAVGR